jgi:hypothetical protein
MGFLIWANLSECGQSCDTQNHIVYSTNECSQLRSVRVFSHPSLDDADYDFMPAGKHAHIGCYMLSVCPTKLPSVIFLGLSILYTSES